jgi:hypothetical protein
MKKLNLGWLVGGRAIDFGGGYGMPTWVEAWFFLLYCNFILVCAQFRFFAMS